MRRFSTPTLLFLLAGLAGTAAGCGGFSSYVESDDSALGRVVVYRNGIAYFERRAQVQGDQLTLKVPLDKVDDFLKSLTVADAKTGDPFPVSFPTRGAAGADGNVDMVIQLPSGGDHDLVLSYITEAPAWKPSYRLVVGDDGKVKVQGWAIVDNTSGEDWNKVRLGVGSSSALSFRYDLRTVHTVHRETLRNRQRFAAAPPRGGVVAKHEVIVNDQIVGSLDDQEIPRPDNHPDMAQADGEEDGVDGNFDQRAGDSKKSGSRRSVYGNEARVQSLASKLKGSRGRVIIEGYSARNERNGKARAADRANLMRNRLIQEGIAPARLEVQNKGWVAGQKPGVRLVQAAGAPPAGKTTKQHAQTEGDPVGESHFESQNTTTVKRGTSAMVSILDGDATGDVVYIYDPEARRGNSRFAFKAVRFKNPTDSTLESGPVTVYGNNRFIGEGLSNPIPPHSTAFVPFALDRQVVVSRKDSTGDQVSRLITLQRGVLTAEVQHLKTTQLTLTNRAAHTAKLYVRHTVRKGWKLTESPKTHETLGEAHLFEVILPPGKTKELKLVEATPLVRTVDLRTRAALDMMAFYLNTPDADKRFAEPMKKLLATHYEMEKFRAEIASTRQRMGDYRVRIDELHAQIVNLQGVKTGGKRLMRHLKDKMMEISNRLQSSTIAVVNLQQQLMLSKIQFQDGIAELTLTPKPNKTAAN